MQLATPKNQTAEVLYFLLQVDKITFSYIYAMTGILNLSARLSNLRLDYGLEIPCVEVETKNKFGRKISYGTWSLKDKESGRIIYSKINR
jgi:hypothetical protein